MRGRKALFTLSKHHLRCSYGWIVLQYVGRQKSHKRPLPEVQESYTSGASQDHANKPLCTTLPGGLMHPATGDSLLRICKAW